MGYDMYLREPDPEVKARVAAATATFNEWVDKRNALPRGSAEADVAQKEVAKAYQAMTDVDTNYFRLNIWGMSKYRDLMRERGMLCDPPRMLDWPKLQDFGLDPDWPDVDDPLTPEAQKWIDAQDVVLREHSGECPGIPAYKFSTNDGWVVTPVECRAALQLNEVSGLALPADVQWWPEWLAWLEHAARHGGFEVH